jgi:hypothetical protein
MGSRLWPGQILHASHLKGTVEAAVVDLVHACPVLRHAVVANQSVSGFFNPRLKIAIRLAEAFSKGMVTLDKGVSAVSTSPRSQVSLSSKMMHTKYYSTASRPPDGLSRQLKSCCTQIICDTVVRGLHQIISTAHLRVQQGDPLAASSALVKGNRAIKPVAHPSTGPFVLHGKRQFHSASVSAGMKSNAPELGADGFVVLIRLNLLLIV